MIFSFRYSSFIFFSRSAVDMWFVIIEVFLPTSLHAQRSRRKKGHPQTPGAGVQNFRADALSLFCTTAGILRMLADYFVAARRCRVAFASGFESCTHCKTLHDALLASAFYLGLLPYGSGTSCHGVWIDICFVEFFFVNTLNKFLY